METTGSLIALPTCTTINTKNGPMLKREFVLSVPGKYETKIAFVAMGDKGDVLDGLMEGEELTIKANVESREFNGRWYTDCKVWSITVKSSGASTGGRSPQTPAVKPKPVVVEEPEEDLPF